MNGLSFQIRSIRPTRQKRPAKGFRMRRFKKESASKFGIRREYRIRAPKPISPSAAKKLQKAARIYHRERNKIDIRLKKLWG